VEKSIKEIRKIEEDEKKVKKPSELLI